MKRKFVASLIIGSMLLMPTAAFADEDKYLYELSFENIKKEMKNRSPIIESSWEQLHDASSNLSTSKLKETLEEIDKKLEDAGKEYMRYKMMNESMNKNGSNGNYNAGENGLPGDDGDQGGSTGENGAQKEYFDMMESAYYAIVNNLTMSKISLEANIKTLESQRDNLWKSYLQVEQVENQLVQGVQSMFLAYFNLLDQRDSLLDAIKMLENQQKVTKVSQALGLATYFDSLKLETQLKEQNTVLKEIDKALESMIGNINLMLGQDYDVDLTLLEPKELRRSLIRNIDYDEDLKEALNQSYDVRLADDHEDLEQAKREFTFAFYQVYKNLKDKLNSLELAEEKLENEKAIYDINYLKHSLGLMSKLEFEGNRLAYRSQVKEVEKAKRELLQAYTDYEWMKKGQKVSTSGGAASSAGAGGMGSSLGSGMGGGMSSGMGSGMGAGMTF